MVLLAVRLLLASMVVLAEVGSAMTAERFGKSASWVALPERGFVLKSRPMMMLPPPSVPFASTVAPMRVVLIRPDCAIVPPSPAPPFVWI